MRIHRLPPELAAKIAAGEVIERPLSAAKELIENALDAGATSIQVELRGGGAELLRVTDDGCGIEPDDLELAIARYATSKVAAPEDLQSVATLGFRGEALASIAAVSRLELISRPGHLDAASFLRVEGGTAVARGHCAAPSGTQVTVRDLFFNVPARRKFLRSAIGEGRAILHLVTAMALAYPEVRFTLLDEGEERFRSLGNGSFQDALVRCFGADTAARLLPLSQQEEGAIRLSGVVSPPDLHRGSRQHVFFFVNRRWIQSRALTAAVEEAYQTALPASRHPIAVLDIRLPYDQVDVNVHPSKLEVRFLREHEVFTAVQRAVRRAVVEAAGVPLVRSGLAPVVVPAGSENGWSEPPGRLFARYDTLPERSLGRDRGREPLSGQAQGTAGAAVEPPLASDESRLFRVLGQIGRTYIVAEGPDGMYLIDQHAAHERVLYEQFRRRLLGPGAPGASQALLQPAALELGPVPAAWLQSAQETFAHLGYALEPFGPTTWLVRAVPAALASKGTAAVEYLRAVVDELADQRMPDAERRERACWSLACHAAVKAGDALTHEEMVALLGQLERCDFSRTCPHGRPTIVHLSHAQLEREFGRR
jgi:DNA mismatch repair protein MutL